MSFGQFLCVHSHNHTSKQSHLFCSIIIQRLPTFSPLCPGSPFSPLCPSGPVWPRSPCGRRAKERQPIRVKDGCVSIQWALLNRVVVWEQNVIAYRFPFLSCQTWNLDDLNNTIKTCHHIQRLSWTLRAYAKWKKGWIIISHDFFFSYLITHTSARLPSCAFVSLGTDRFTWSFIFAWKFITSDYETFCDGITFLLTCCFPYDYT